MTLWKPSSHVYTEPPIHPSKHTSSFFSPNVGKKPDAHLTYIKRPTGSEVQQEVKSNRKCGDPRQAGVSESTKEE
ncbi:unnamed protein product [Arctogadus glacialis]